MSRTSLGQRNDMAKREDVPSMRMVGSAVRLSQDKYQQQATLNFQEEVDSFLFMRDKYARVERDTQYLHWEMGETFCSIKEDFGIYVFKNGDRYVGEWKNKIMEGRGIYTFYSLDPAHRIVYLGDFHNSRFSGFGKLAQFHQNAGEMIYSGTWLEGKKTYQGLHYYQHPHTFYQGEWANDLKHGQGKLLFSNGEFEGKWEADRRQGPGQLKKTEVGITQVYEGQWEQDQLPFGKVTYYDQKNSEVGRYEGQLMEGKKHGTGVYSWRGAKYEGEFQNDCIQGKGLFKIGKTSFRGQFNSDYDIINSPQINASIAYENGDQFEGVVAIREGKAYRLRGLYQFGMGDVAEGEFADNPRGDLKGRLVYRWSNGQSKQLG